MAISKDDILNAVSEMSVMDLNELVNAPVTYFDGRHDNFKSPPAETRHL